MAINTGSNPKTMAGKKAPMKPAKGKGGDSKARMAYDAAGADVDGGSAPAMKKKAPAKKAVKK